MYNDVRFTLNGKPMVYTGNPLRRLLDVLRERVMIDSSSFSPFFT